MKRVRALSYVITILVMVTTPAVAQSGADAIETTTSGTINWTVGEVYATGIGAPPAQAANMAQARGMAERAAFVVALRNLLETVKGVQVDSETVIENFMSKSDVIRTKVDGIVKGARIVKKQYMSDGSVEITVSMPMKGALMNAFVPETFGRPAPYQLPQKPSVTPQKPSDIRPAQPVPEKKTEPVKPSTPAMVPEKKREPVQPAPAEPEKKAEPAKPAPPASDLQSGSTVAFKGGVATGLVIDARGLGLRPALLPRVVDQQGQEIYVGQVVTRTNAVEQGVAGYAKDVNAAANNFRVTDNPAVIKALSATGTARTDIVLGQADAQALRRLSSNGEFLQYCRVVIVY